MHNYASSRETVELINERPQRIYSYFSVTTLTESACETRNKRNSFFLLLYLCSIFFSLSTQHTQSTYKFPIWHSPLVSSPLTLRLVISSRKEEKRDRERRRRSLISGAQSPLCFPIPRSSANVDCGRRGRSRVFAPPADRVNTLIDAENIGRGRRMEASEK